MSEKIFDVIQVENQHALPTFDELFKAHSTTGKYPFIIGNDKDLEELHAMIEPPEDGGAAFINASIETNVEQWLNSKNWKKPKSLAKDIPAQSGFSVLYDILTGEPKPKIYIGLIGVEKPYHVFAKLGYGGWNDCPTPEIHVALHKYWNEKHGSIPVAITEDVVECFVANPPTQNSDILTLAGEQHAYCYDIVEQGYGSKTKLAASISGAKVWYFWWD